MSTIDYRQLPSPPLPTLSARAADSHKGNFGHALVCGGSRGMAGSIALTARAALVAGAGLVTAAVPDRILETVALLNPSAMCLPLVDDEQGRMTIEAYAELSQRFERTTCLAFGPGLGRSPSLQRLAIELFTHAPIPCVIDADALNNLVDAGLYIRGAAPRILTPHPGEWSRICGVKASDTEAQRQAAVQWAHRYGWVIVLKGQHTLITDGASVILNSTGTPAMASGGSGDVLTGVITALVCQGLAPRDAAHLGVHVHGLAGQLAQTALGGRVVLAEQLTQYIDRALSP